MGLDKNRLGLTLGLTFALVHAVWSILVAIGAAKYLMDKALSLHHIALSYSIMDFSLTKAVVLVIATFIGGYVAGWVIGCFWNMVKREG